MLTLAGNHVITIHSKLKGPGVTYDYMSGPGQSKETIEKMALDCDSHSMVTNAPRLCWHEYKTGAVMTPIHEFEHAVLRAMDLLGDRRLPLNAAYSMLEGEAQNSTGPILYEEGWYEKHAYRLCPPP
jgi:hypothetical protein